MDIKTPKVGIIIPIYNVQNYLKECIDSVLNQTYKNLEIVLVNDGSTDSSFEIALDYVKKNKNIILIDKENGGLSSARNAGILYFKQSIDSNLNPLKIKKLYKHDKEAPIQNLDSSFYDEKEINYLMFLDSDDFLDLNCLEESIQAVQTSNAQILWFDMNIFFDGMQPYDFKTEIELANYTKQQIISKQDWLDDFKKIGSFWWSWQGLIDFKFLKQINLEFINGIIHEDHHFGKLLFIQSEKIHILPKKFYHYRIRANSITTGSQTALKEIDKDSYVYPIYKEFKNLADAKAYFKAASFVITLNEIVKFGKTHKTELEQLKEAFLKHSAEIAFGVLEYENDPLLVKEIFKDLEDFIYSQLKMPDGAVSLVNLSLEFEIGRNINKTKGIKWLFLPLKILKINRQFRFKRKIKNIIYETNPNLRPKPLNTYRDYKQALEIKNSLNYKLGEMVLKNKFSYLFKIKKIKNEFKK